MANYDIETPVVVDVAYFEVVGAFLVDAVHLAGRHHGRIALEVRVLEPDQAGAAPRDNHIEVADSHQDG